MNAGSVNQDGELTAPGEEDEAVRIREAEPADIPFILGGWLKSFRIGDLCKGVGNDAYYGAHKKVVTHLLRRCTVLVACVDSAPAVDLGFIVAEVLPDGTRLGHYAYVKEDLRNHGIFKMMEQALDDIEPAERTVVTHTTRRGKKLMARRDWEYNPYLLWATLPGGWDRDVGEPRPLLPARVRNGARG